MKVYKGIIFDMNGTMIDDMHLHESAWYDVLVNQLNAPLSREQVKEQIYGKHDEMFHRIFGKSRFSLEEITEIGTRKEALYREQFLPELKLIDGLDDFLYQTTNKQIALGIGTAAPVENIDFVLDNLKIRDYFKEAAIIGADQVTKSKPDPEVFLKAAYAMGVNPTDCVVFEDVPKGIEAARRAGMHAIGIATFHTPEELKSDNVIAIIKDYSDSQLIKFFDL